MTNCTSLLPLVPKAGCGYEWPAGKRDPGGKGEFSDQEYDKAPPPERLKPHLHLSQMHWKGGCLARREADT